MAQLGLDRIGAAGGLLDIGGDDGPVPWQGGRRRGRCASARVTGVPACCRSWAAQSHGQPWDAEQGVRGETDAATARGQGVQLAQPFLAPPGLGGREQQRCHGGEQAPGRHTGVPVAAECGGGEYFQVRLDRIEAEQPGGWDEDVACFFGLT